PLVDLVIVVGSPHSSNAKRLSEVALSGGAKKSVLVDSKDELTDEIFEEVSTAAITSAASTPEVLVREVVDFLESKYGIAIEEFKLQDDTDEKG
ncbi:MAG: 4-hydroxy-3-methylbut-2-enyl diphosphate reductase, partial [Alphaproteobacteria bacterium]|nr:4-hydroxy-3-methylbut-2-enyl diphosphate reductase [Alphaproteobacteria bacterium]